MSDNDDGEVTPIRQFTEFLVQQRQGRTHADLTTGFNDLLEAVRSTGKGGSITLTVKVKPEGGRLMKVSDEVTTKLPKADRDPALFYVTDDNELSRDNPDQPRLPLKSVESPDAAKAKEVKGA